MPSAAHINVRSYGTESNSDSDDGESRFLLGGESSSRRKHSWPSKRKIGLCACLSCIGCTFVLFAVMMALVPVLVHDASRLTLVVEQLTLYDLCNNPQSMSMTVRSTNPGFLPLKFHRATVRVDTIGLPHDGPIAILHTPVDVPLGTAIRTINASLTITDEKRASALLQQALDEDGAPYDLLMTVVKINGFKLPFPTSSIPDNSAVNMSVASRAYDSPLLMAAHQLGLNGDGGILGQGVFHMMPQNALCQVLPGLSVNITIGNATSPIPLSGYPANLCRPGPVLSTLNYTISNDNLPIAREMIAAGMVGGNFSAVFTGGGGNTSCLVQRIFNGVRSHRTLRLEARGGNPDRALGEMLSKASLDIAVQPDGKPIHFPCFLWCYGPNETSIQRDFPSSAPTPSFRIPMHVNGTITNQLPFSLSGIDSATLAFSEYNHTFGHVTLGPLPPAKAHGPGSMDAAAYFTVTDEYAMSRLMNELIVDATRRRVGVAGVGAPSNLLPPSSVEMGPLPDNNKLATLHLAGSNETVLSLLFTGYFYNPGRSRLLLGKPDMWVHTEGQLVGHVSVSEEVVIKADGTSKVLFNMDFIKDGSENIFGEFMSRFAFAQPVDLHLVGTVTRNGLQSPVEAHFPKFWLQSLQVAADNFITNTTITSLSFDGVPNPFKDECKAVLTVKLYVHNPFGFPLNCDAIALEVFFNDTNGSPPLGPATGIRIGVISRDTPLPTVPATSSIPLELPLPVGTFETCWRLFYHRVREGREMFVDIPYSNITLSTGPFHSVIHESFWHVPVEVVV